MNAKILNHLFVNMDWLSIFSKALENFVIIEQLFFLFLFSLILVTSSAHWFQKCYCDNVQILWEKPGLFLNTWNFILGLHMNVNKIRAWKWYQSVRF